MFVRRYGTYNLFRTIRHSRQSAGEGTTRKKIAFVRYVLRIHDQGEGEGRVFRKFTFVCVSKMAIIVAPFASCGTVDRT